MKSLNPLLILRMHRGQRHLLAQLIKRDVLLRYRGAYFGLIWVILNPLIMLGIYVFVLGQIFGARWSNQYGDVPFALVLFAGLIPFNLFGETLSRAPTAVSSQPSYVKKIIFPVEILPIVPLGAASVQTAFNFLILTCALSWMGHLSIQFLLYPLLLLPIILLALGGSWFVASWGVFIKDVVQVVPIIVQMLFFLSPVLYRASMVPEFLRPVFLYNPIGSVIEACRATITGTPVDWAAWLVALIFAMFVAFLGYAVFQNQRDEFADVL